MLLFKDHRNPTLSLGKKLESVSSNLGDEFDQRIIPRKNGLTAMVIKNRRPMMLDNPAMSPGLNPEAKKNGIKSYICLPMMVGNLIIGVLFVHYRTPQFFYKNEFRTYTLLSRLSLCANLAAAAIENARLMEGLNALSQTSGKLSKSKDFEAALESIVEAAIKVTSADSSTIYLLDKTSIPNRFVIGCRSPIRERLQIELPRLHGGLTRHILDTGESIKIDDTNEPIKFDYNKRKIAISEALKREGAKSLIGVCLQMGSEKIGVLYVSGRTKRQFENYHIGLLQMVADQASVAVGYARMLLKPSSEIEQVTSGFFQLDGLFDKISKEVKRYQNFDFVSLQMIRSDEDVIESVHGVGIAEKWSSLSRHYLEEDIFLRDIQADIAKSEPPALEVIAGNDYRFDPYIYNKHAHSNYVRIFIPMVLVLDQTGEIDTCWYQDHLWKPCSVFDSIPNPKLKCGTVLKMCMQDLSGKATKKNVKIIGTIEAGFTNPKTKIKAADANYLANLVAKRTIEIYKVQLPSVLKLILEQAKNIIGADSASLHYPYEKQSGRYLNEVSLGREIDQNFLKKFPPRKTGLGFEAMITGLPKFIPDLSQGHNDKQLEQINPGIYAYGIKSMAAFPLIVSDSEKGVLYLHFRNIHRFTLDERSLVKLFASHAAHVINHALLYKQRREYTQQLEALNSVAYSLVSTSQESDFLEEIAWNILHLFAADLVTIYTVGIYEDTPLEERIKTPPATVGKFKVDPKESMATRVAENNAPIELINQGENVYAINAFENKIMNSPQHKHAARKYSPFVMRENIKSSAGILLKVENQIVGVMFINYRRPHYFAKIEIDIVEKVASWVAIAIRNRKLYEALNAVDKKIITTFDYQQLLSTVVRLAVEVTNAQIGEIRLPDPSKPQWLRVH